MKYNFDYVVNRRATDSCKWDSDNDPQMLPMWIADMDFKTAPKIIDALSKRVIHGVFGYTDVPQSYYDAVCNWFERRHGWHINQDRIIYTTSVIAALSAVLKALTKKSDKVLVQTPVYNCFFSSIRNNGCEILSSPLKRVDSVSGFTYEMDFEDFENKCQEAKVFILCNPHNPAGRVWTKEELVRIKEICHRHSVQVISDEIHCELCAPGIGYVPYANIDSDAIVCVSPSKAFNIAGLQIANIVCPNETLQHAIDRAININEVCDVNPFGVIATQVAYNECEDWLDELNTYIYSNYLMMSDFVKNRLPDFPLAVLEGTYLVWMDCKVLGLTSSVLEQRLKTEVHLHLNSGTMYGADGEGYMRWNLACPCSVLKDGLERFEHFTIAEKKAI